MEIKIVIADNWIQFKSWCAENNIDYKQDDCEHRYMINDYSVRGVLVKEVIDISTKQTPGILRNITIANIRKNTQGELLNYLY